MNIQFRSVVTSIVLLACIVSSTPVSAAESEVCVAPYKQMGYMEDWMDGDLAPECSPAAIDEGPAPMWCVRPAPPVMQAGTLSSPGFSALACPAPYDPKPYSAIPIVEPAPNQHDCNTIINTSAPRHC